MELDRRDVDEARERERSSKELEDLLVCLAEQDLSIKRLKDRLREMGELVSDDEEEDGDDFSK